MTFGFIRNRDLIGVKGVGIVHNILLYITSNVYALYQEHKRFLNVCVTFAYPRSQTENEQNTNGA